MTGQIDKRLADIGLTLPEASAPAGNYVPYVLTGNLLFISGQVPIAADGHILTGKVGHEGMTTVDAQKAARLCAINILAQARAALDGDLDRVTRCVKLGGFVNCDSHFTEHPKVVNGASDLMVEVFGDAGRHARFAVGAPSLPLDVAVEVDAVFEVRV